MSLKFGTSGLRGLSVDLDGPAAALYATAFVRHLLESGQAKPGDEIMIGRDFRASSPSISAICAGALMRAGFSVVDCGTVPTPALALYARERRAAALMVTGSHIPADRNGIKFYRSDGEITKADEEAIALQAQRLMAEVAVDAAPAAARDGIALASARFLARNTALLPPSAFAGLRVGVYQHSTVARDLFVDVLVHYGADVVALGRSADFIPVDTEAVSSATVESLRGWAGEYGLDAIVSADGDGDRPLVADETGTPLRGDFLGLAAALFLGATVGVTPVTSNSGLERHLPILRTRVGSPYVIAGMEEAVARGDGGVVGFEANGGTLTATDFAVNGGILAALPTRDSFLPALAVLALARKSGLTLSALVADHALPVAVADRIENVPVETSAALMAHLRKSPENLSAFLDGLGRPSSVIDIDGLRVTLANDSVIHFRPSGNAPEMRCYVEAQTEAAAGSLLAEGLERIRAFATQHR